MKRVITWSIAAAVLAVGTVQAEQTAPVQDFSIESQPIGDALKEFARQSGYQVFFPSELTKSIDAPQVVGRMSPEQAVSRLLSYSGLSYRFVNARTLAIRVAQDSQWDARLSSKRSSTVDGSQDTAQKAERSFSDGFRLAQGDQGETTSSSSLDKQPRQGSFQTPDKLEEVVVTAQKREERLIDVPISIVALSGDDLQNRKLTSLDDLQFAVPGMAVSSDGFANRIELRGVSNALGLAPLVGVYLDEADVTNGAGMQINPNTYDLERVEVLRGPQGTLYGEGSAGGTVRFITKNPVLDQFGMTASVASSFTQDGSPGERINTAINVPLIDNEFGIRVVGTYDREGGWIDQPAASLKDINGQDLTNVRVKGLWKPSSRFSASFMAELYRNDRSAGTNDDARGNFTQTFNLTTTPEISEDYDVYNLTLTYDFSVVRVLSTTSYFHEKAEAKDMGYNTTYSGPPPLTYGYLAPYQLSEDHAWIEELRLSSIESGPWQWTVGGFYRRYRNFYDQPSGYSALLGPPGTALPSSYGALSSDILYKSWSVFGDINYRLWERFTLGFGLRSFHESQDYISVSDYGSGPSQTDQMGRFHSVDPRVYAQYNLSRDINLYASAAKGFRSGGFNFDPTTPTFAPEDVRTYELGTKMSLLNGRLRAEAAIFYTDYRDYVVVALPGQGNVNATDLNAGNARIKGVEWDLVWRPSDRWSLGINGNYYDSRFTKINATALAYAVGDPLDGVPRYQIASSAERDFSWGGKPVSMRLDYSRRGRETFRVRNVGLYGESDVVNLLGYSMNLQWSKSLSFDLFAQNLLNDRGLIVPVVGGTVRSRPRTYGVGFDASF